MKLVLRRCFTVSEVPSQSMLLGTFNFVAGGGVNQNRIPGTRSGTVAERVGKKIENY